MRALVLTGAVALAALATPATAAPVRYRTVRVDYATTAGVADVISGSTFVNGDEYGSVTVPTQRGEYAVDVTLVDGTARPVLADVRQDVNGDGQYETTLGRLCGKSTAPLRLKRASRPVSVYLLTGQCGSGVSAPTSGTVVLRFARR